MNFLYLTILSPLIGFFILSFFFRYLSEKSISIIGISSVGGSLFFSIYIFLEFFKNNQIIFIQKTFTWIKIDNFIINCTLILDKLSLMMLFVVIFIGFLVHVFSVWYMKNQDRYPDFFAYTNIFISSMIILVLSDNFLFMYFGWESVSICSYLLIGFYYKDKQNGKFAIKSFLMTRISDVFLICSFFILYNEFHTLNFSEISKILSFDLLNHSSILNYVPIMLLIGAVGKSAQFPLHVWIPSAMVGPTPVSALIHAATMVTAGVYLISRTYFIFSLTPKILFLISIIGSITLLSAAFLALFQTDIKKILAYSTISQIGYMFLALGLIKWEVSIFHLMNHAFFKALLFLLSGSIIFSCLHEKNIFKMGGLNKKIPFVYFCMLISGASLASFPMTSGFFSKEKILIGILNYNFYFLIVALLGTFITTLYISRMILYVFHGKIRIYKFQEKNILHNIPLIILTIFSTFLGPFLFSKLINLEIDKNNISNFKEIILSFFSIILNFFGTLISIFLWKKYNKLPERCFYLSLKKKFTNISFDIIYDYIFTKTYLKIVKILKNDPMNKFINLLKYIIFLCIKYFSFITNGYLRRYILLTSLGATFLLFFI